MKHTDRHRITHSAYTKTIEYKKENFSTEKKQKRIDQIQKKRKKKKNNILDKKNHSKLPYLLFFFIFQVTALITFN
jgi:hypothetical protein